MHVNLDRHQQQLLLSDVKLHHLTHLTDYLQNIQSPRNNPLEQNSFFHPISGFYISSTDVILRHILFDLSGTFSSPPPYSAYHRAGPRKHIYFQPSQVQAAIVTCGGLCPGLNTVIRELVMVLWDLYGVRQIFGIKAGYRGFYSYEPIQLNPKMVHHLHRRGGTFLQTSRGGFHLQRIVDSIQNSGFNQVYIIGGVGTMRGALAIFEEIKRSKLNIAVAGIPKTVDNDVGIIDRSFGFQTAVEMVQQSISAAHLEAESAVNGIGLVKLMGRSTGHIAVYATRRGLFEFLEGRLKENNHAVVVVAEGAGQDLIPPPPISSTSVSEGEAQEEEKKKMDESGNLVFLDIGGWLKSELNKWWARDHPKEELFTVKYIDPTYMIRAVAANVLVKFAQM
ncbi:hypothetical protein M9H77_11661 [Catharanthus roseus]|uniref:Uncharacterized protein n=1 Tax=Catharanthus roseus TaxID=4058 RepID=A0ACC0BF96_CATRO|nr:hypothetical protein M9H77_11661 [Catharanthus roseus]